MGLMDKMTQCWGALLVLAVGLALSQLAGAAQTVDLYRTQVLVTSQSTAERGRAAAQGLAEILTRVSGQADANRRPAVRQALKTANRYLSEFSYASTDETLERAGEERPATRLLLAFSPALVDKLLRQAQLPAWPANRPTLMVWLVADDVSQGRHLVEDEESLDVLRKAAQRRGLPIVTPLLDLEDRVAISAADLWSFDEAKLQAASARYQADAILVGRYSQTSRGRWLASWQLLHKQGDGAFDSRRDQLTEVMNNGIDQVADHMAGLYAIVPRDSAFDRVVLQVAGVHDFAAYRATLDYLQRLRMVRRATLRSVQGQALELTLQTEGELSLLLDTLALDNKLVPVESVPDGSMSLPGNRYLPRGSEQNPLLLRWAG